MCVTMNVCQVRYVCYYKHSSGTVMCVTINVRQVRYVCYYERSSGALCVLL